MLRYVKQRLFLEIKVTRDHLRPGMANPEPALREIEIPLDRRGCRGKDHAVQVVEQLLFENRRHIDRRGLQEYAAAPPLDPIHVRTIAAEHEELEPCLDIGGPAYER